MNITITSVSRGKNMTDDGKCRIYAITADRLVYSCNELCDNEDHGDMLTAAEETMYLAQIEGIESDEWTLVDDLNS